MLLVVGRIGRAHGVLGEATIEVRTDSPEERFALGSVLVTEPSIGGPLTITSARVHNGILLLGFQGVNDRNQVENLRDTILLAEVDVNAAGEDEDDFHVLQLIDCDVVTSAGVELGKVTDVIALPGQDLLSIAGNNGEILIPFVYELVPDVDIANKRITVVPPEGLIDGA
ncbi:MAG: ribosome maturation factor RimM [Actinomycetes bacterium]